jgi:4a-hydroxytetrahydrobiopterin dehydratase
VTGTVGDGGPHGERLHPARVGSPRLEGAELAALAAEIPEWRVVAEDGVERLERTFRMPSYRAGLGFTLAVGRLAEAADHHPAILTEFGRVTVRWWTWTVRGLHRNDIVMAAKTDYLFKARQWEAG